MEGGGFGTVTEIHEDHMRVRHLEGLEYRHQLNGLFGHHRRDSPYDLLPAIEPAKEGFSKPTVSALTAYLDFWMAFRGDVQEGLIDPCDHGYWTLTNAGCIKCSYPTREAALSEAAAVIAAVDALLEGRAG